MSIKRRVKIAKKLGCSKRQIQKFSILASDSQSLAEVSLPKVLNFENVLYLAILSAFELAGPQEGGIDRDWFVRNLGFKESFIDSGLKNLMANGFVTEDQNGRLNIDIDKHSTIDVGAIPDDVRNTFVDQALNEVHSL